ncbi:MAG: hypothetical protein U9R11_00270 [Chloroflexota bacterium]|nr:hypothetical protein [Chloroflexota bacterium]
MDKNVKIIVCCIIGAAASYFMNHNLGYGAVIASGIVGVAAAILLPAELAGPAYTASFAGMSAAAVLPNLAAAAVAGLVVGLVWILTLPIYSGCGGKMGTIAATSVLIIRRAWKLVLRG